MMCPYKGKVEGHLRQKRGQIWKRDDKKIEDKKKRLRQSLESCGLESRKPRIANSCQKLEAGKDFP